MLRKNHKRILIIFSVLIVIVGIVLLIHIKYQKNNQNIKKNNIHNSFDLMSYDKEQINESQSNNDNLEKEKMNFIAHLIIPKIKLEQGLVSKDSIYNSVDKNIQILKDSNMPDVENGNLILAAHSGNSSIAYFKDIDKLQKGDIVYIEYDNYKYTYYVSYHYIVEKTGKINIVRNNNKKTLTLITCLDNTNKQIVVICEIVNNFPL